MLVRKFRKFVRAVAGLLTLELDSKQDAACKVSAAIAAACGAAAEVPAKIAGRCLQLYSTSACGSARPFMPNPPAPVTLTSSVAVTSGFILAGGLRRGFCRPLAAVRLNGTRAITRPGALRLVNCANRNNAHGRAARVAFCGHAARNSVEIVVWISAVAEGAYYKYVEGTRGGCIVHVLDDYPDRIGEDVTWIYDRPMFLWAVGCRLGVDAASRPWCMCRNAGCWNPTAQRNQEKVVVV